jgi:hypothetical protein
MPLPLDAQWDELNRPAVLSLLLDGLIPPPTA